MTMPAPQRNPAKPKRRYSPKTLKILFGLSSNRCAHPECTIPLIEPATAYSDAVVIAHICHIYAFSVDGPRGLHGLTGQHLNSPDNLILLCRNHHAIVDGQHETYPAETLKRWKQDHESTRILSRPNFPTTLVDREIDNTLTLLRQSRFFVDFHTVNFALTFAANVSVGHLSGGSPSVAARALAWCARVLSDTKPDDANNCVSRAAALVDDSPELTIARAFLLCRASGTAAAVQLLTGLDLPIARSAAHIIIARHDGLRSAEQWLTRNHIVPANLDSDGQRSLLAANLELTDLSAAQTCAAALTDDDFRDLPVFHCLVGISHLLTAVPSDLYAPVLRGVPCHVAADFPLASIPAAVAARRLARHHFAEAAARVQKLQCPLAANESDLYALWLELRDPEQHDGGTERLKSRLRNSQGALHLVPLALQFDIDVNLDAVQREIDRQIALNGKTTRDAALARFALALARGEPRAVVHYIDQHREELAEHVEQKAIEFLRIEMLPRAGSHDRAADALQSLVASGVSATDERRLRRIISEAKGVDPVAAKTEQYRETNSISDLTILVKELHAQEAWRDACEYGKLLFERTRSLEDATRFVTALYRQQQYDDILSFLDLHRALLDQSSDLKMTHCWSLYHSGRLLDARSELAAFERGQDTANYRTLQLNLCIALGDWGSIPALVATEHARRGGRNARELLATARLATHLNLATHAKELTRTAVIGASDPHILAAAYFVASAGGWEDEPDAVKWLQRAVSLSGDTGPIRSVTLKELVDRKPSWDRHESRIWKQLAKGEVPIFLVAQSLKRSLVSMLLLPALENPTVRDVRRRAPILTVSARRQGAARLALGGSVGIDATSLLTLGFLGLLERAIGAFEAVHLPHSTLFWLFDEKCDSAFHQPSRVKEARRLESFLAAEVFGVFAPITVGDSDLAEQVGDDLASLIVEATAQNDREEAQHLVVRPSPVYRVSSLMEEEANLTSHENVLSSCEAVIKEVRKRGQLTATEEQKALSYLGLHEKPWPGQPGIRGDATLYMDEITLTYFLHVDVLEQVAAAGFRILVSPKVMADRRTLLSYDRASDRVAAIIESIRATVNSAIENGKVRIGSQGNQGGDVQGRTMDHPTCSILSLAAECDAILVDDRFVNRNAYMEIGGARAPVYCTLDCLEALQAGGVLTSEERRAYRTQLRRAGYFFIPVEHDELADCLRDSDVEGERVIETAELRAIRESVLCVRMSNCLQLPEEGAWLDQVISVSTRVLRELWRDGSDVADVRVRANWIMRQIDIRGWVQAFSENGENLMHHVRGEQILRLIAPPVDVGPDVKEAYHTWVDEEYMKPVRDGDPVLYAEIVGRLRQSIVRSVNDGLTEGGQDVDEC